MLQVSKTCSPTTIPLHLKAQRFQHDVSPLHINSAFNFYNNTRGPLALCFKPPREVANGPGLFLLETIHLEFYGNMASITSL